MLFDLDDTLLDYSGGVEESWTQAVQTCRLDGHWSPSPRRRPGPLTALVLGRSAPASGAHQHDAGLATIAAHALESLQARADDLVAAIAPHFAAHRRETMHLFPESRATLDRLRAQGAPLGLVTNGDAVQQRYKIDHHDLARYFDVIVIEGEFGTGKPDEVVFRHALDTLGADPAGACMVGDSLHNDVEGARRLGIRGVWVDRAGTGLPAGSPVSPDHIIASLTELFVLRS